MVSFNPSGGSFNERDVLNPSLYLHIFRRGTKIALLHALSLEKVFGTEDLGRLIDTFQDGRTVASVLSEFSLDLRHSVRLLIEKLHRLGMLVAPTLDERSSLQALQRKVEQVQPNSLKMLVTHKCNFNCAYCQIEQNMHPEFRRLSMTPKIADKSFELFNLVSLDSALRTVIVTGGEPLLNIATAKYIIKTAPERLGNVRIVLFTNGSLVTQCWAQFLERNNVLVLVSLDAPPTSDGARLSRGKDSASTIAMRGYQIYKEARCQVGISAVVDRTNIEQLEDEVIQFFLDLNPDSLGLNFQHYLVNSSIPQLVPMEQYVQKLIGCYKIAREHGLFIEQMSRRIIPFASNTPRYLECSASGLGITVDSRGYVGACKVPMVNKGQGKPLKVAIEQTCKGERGAIFPGWTGRSSLNIPQCQDCFAVAMCGGGCAYDSWCQYGNVSQVDPRACTLTKDLFEFLVWDLYESLESEMMLAHPLPFLHPTLEQQKIRYQEYFRVRKSLSESAGHQQTREVANIL